MNIATQPHLTPPLRLVFVFGQISCGTLKLSHSLGGRERVDSCIWGNVEVDLGLLRSFPSFVLKPVGVNSLGGSDEDGTCEDGPGKRSQTSVV